MTIYQDAVNKFKEAFIYFTSRYGAMLGVNHIFLFNVFERINASFFCKNREILFCENDIDIFEAVFDKALTQMLYDNDIVKLNTDLSRKFSPSVTRYIPRRLANLDLLTAIEFQFMERYFNGI